MLVLFAGYWGFVSVLGYPLGTDIFGAWIMANALVPLAVPAGVGLAMVVGWARDAFHTDSVRFGVSAFLLVLVVGQVALGLAGGVYTNQTADDNALVQYAQPADDFRPAMAALEGNVGDGTDVLFVNGDLVRESPRQAGIEPTCSSISSALPLQWYVEMHGATADCAGSADEAAAVVASDRPTVVVAPASSRQRLAAALEGYESSTHRVRTHGSRLVFFVDRGA